MLYQNKMMKPPRMVPALLLQRIVWNGGLNIQLMVLTLIVVVIKKIPSLLYLTKMMVLPQALVKKQIVLNFI